MGRDDEIIVSERKDGTWWVGHVSAQNYGKYKHEKGQYADYKDALVAAHDMDSKHRGTQYGVRVLRVPKVKSKVDDADWVFG